MSKKIQADNHGKAAQSPRQIPWRGWRDIIIRVKSEIGNDNIGIVSAGVSFYALLAIFPALSAVIATYGLLFKQADVEDHLAKFIGLLPEDAGELLLSQLSSLVSSNSTTLSFGVAISLGVALWSATKGVRAIISALNIVYAEREARGFFKLNAIALIITFSGVLFVVVALVSTIFVPAYFNSLAHPDIVNKILAWFRWPLIAIIMVFGLSAIYRFAPSRQNAKWQWVSYGGVIATILWLIGSWAFSYYVSNFGSYNETYGSLGAVIILLMWFFVSTWIVLLGAEINAEIEHQTGVDTTTGSPEPIGERGAIMADSIGERFS